MTYSGLEHHQPTRGEIWAWFVHEECSYFVHTLLIPIVFSLIVAKIVDLVPTDQSLRGWNTSANGSNCNINEMKLYERLTHRSISIGISKVSPLEWTSISWAIGIILATPTLRFISINLDRGSNQRVIDGAATVIGAFLCLPAGFLEATWIFPLYIAPIVVAITVAIASHTRHYGLMIRSFTRPITLQRGRVLSGLSFLYGTVSGSLWCGVIAAITYYTHRYQDIFTGLWVVSIFSGLVWLVGIVHIFALRPGPGPGPGASTINSPLPKDHFLSIFKYHHGLISLVVVVVGLSSFTSMCIFTGGLLYLVGELCLKPVFLLSVCLMYFVFPSISLPLLVQPVQSISKANAARMHMLGLILSLITSGVGFLFRRNNWEQRHLIILIFAAMQSTSTGLMHVSSRALLMGCSPSGTEGAFAMWFSWVKMVGTCLGFAVASGISTAGSVGTALGTTFCTVVVAMLVLLYVYINDIAGVVDTGLISISRTPCAITSHTSE